MDSDFLPVSRRGLMSGLALTASTACSATSTTSADHMPGNGGGVSVADFGAKGDGKTDDTAAIQRAIDTSGSVYFPGARSGRIYRFTNLVLRLRTRLHGDGPRTSVLRQIAAARGAAITAEPGKPPSGYGVDDITEGAYAFENIGIEVASPIGIAVTPGSLASMFQSNNLRLVHQHSETLRQEPYSVASGTRGFALDGSKGSAIFMADHRNLEIRSFDVAIDARNVVNEWRIHGWIINCRTALALDEISTWRVELSCETGVPGARMFRLSRRVANLIVDGGRCEMTERDGYMFEFVGDVAAANIRIRNPNMNIQGDGGSWPGRKYTGPLPQDVTFDFSRADNPVIAASPGTTLDHAVDARFGGTALGDGKIILGRNAGGADAELFNSLDGYLRIACANGVRISGEDTRNHGIEINGKGVGFHGATPIGRPVVSGSRRSGAALAALLEILDKYGLIDDRSTP